jgi:hypothetical protein
MLLIGLLTGDNIVYVLADFRAIFFFILFSQIVLFSNKSIKSFKKFVFDIFIILSLLDCVFLLTREFFFDIDIERFIVMTACPFVVSIKFLNKNKYILSFLFLAILVYESVVSSMRINYLFIIFYIFYIVTYIIGSLGDKKLSFLKISIFTILLTFAAIKVAPVISAYFDASGTRYVHSVKRTENAINNFEESESIRINTTLIFLYEPYEFLIPQGIGWRNHIKRIQIKFRQEYNILSTMDSNIFYCIYHFGLFLGIFIIIMIFKSFLKLLFRLTNKVSKLGLVYYSVIIFSILSMFVLKSWIFVYLNFGFIYGLLIILVKYPDKELLKKSIVSKNKF